jgi:hypothetical protein
LLLNGSSSLDDLEKICKEFFQFAYTLALVILKNPQQAKAISLSALANALLEAHKYPGGDPRAWLAHHTYNACRDSHAPSTVENRQIMLTTPMEADTWNVINGLDTETRIQAALYFGCGLSWQDIAQISRQPDWLVVDTIHTVRDLCLRRMQWTGIYSCDLRIEHLFRQALDHQFSAAILTDEQANQLALSLAKIVTHKKTAQKRRIYLQQCLMALIVIAVLFILFWR